MEATGAKDYRRECKYGVKCYQKNPEHKSKFKHSAKELEEKENQENRENQANGVVSSNVNKEGNKRQHSDTDDTVDVKKIRSDSIDNDDTTDGKAAKPHDLSESGGDDSSHEEEDLQTEKAPELEITYSDLVPEKEGAKAEEEIGALLGVEMPPDFYSFWEFAKTVNKENPLLCLSSVGLKLCGAFELLAGTVPSGAPRSRSLFLTHQRFHFDPPELQTVVCEISHTNGVHLGYFRDSPEQAPSLVVVGVEAQGAKLASVGDNLFAGVYNYLVERLEEGDPFSRTKVTGMMEKIKLWVNKSTMTGNDSLTLEKKTASMKNRDRLKVASGAHGAGILVPYDKKTEVGYREVPETPANLKKMFTKVVEAETEEERELALDPVQQLVNFVQFANDEGDPGMGLELGMALFCHGGQALHPTLKHLLSVAYELLNRDLYGEIISAHLEQRSKGKEPDSFARWRTSDEK